MDESGGESTVRHESDDVDGADEGIIEAEGHLEGVVLIYTGYSKQQSDTIRYGGAFLSLHHRR